MTMLVSNQFHEQPEAEEEEEEAVGQREGEGQGEGEEERGQPFEGKPLGNRSLETFLDWD